MGKKVLLIDDDADDRALYCEALETVAPDFFCVTASNGRTALANLRSMHNDLPDLIFLDINMPLMNGWQCLSLLKETEPYRSIPVIMYSTSTHAEDMQKAQEAGAFCFFSKPSNYGELKKCLEHVAFHLTNNTLPLLAERSPFYVATTSLPG